MQTQNKYVLSTILGFCFCFSLISYLHKEIYVCIYMYILIDAHVHDQVIGKITPGQGWIFCINVGSFG